MIDRHAIRQRWDADGSKRDERGRRLFLLTLTAPAFAADYYIVQNPTTKVCTITQERPASGGGIVIGAPFGVRVEAENRMKTVKECTERSTTGGATIQERREERR